MFHPVNISDYLLQAPGVQLLDVRTPAEFSHGHIPGALNLPLFSNEERVVVGTAYKQQGKEVAILLGFDLTGPKWAQFIKDALVFAPSKKVAVHCWRGGMRSGAMAWALDLYGFEVTVISGGYKNYRRWTQQVFAREYNLCLLGGMTGSGKTRILHELHKLGEQVVDLEDIARHQGSVFGSMNRLVQPTQEQFENDLASALSKLDQDRRIWVEDESINIGKCQIPKAFWNQMQKARLIDLRVPLEHRVTSLTADYGSLDKSFLVECTEKIKKRLGPEQCKLAVTAINENRMEDFIRQVLIYYDKTYRTGLDHRPADAKTAVVADNANDRENAIHVLATVKTKEAINKKESINENEFNIQTT